MLKGDLIKRSPIRILEKTIHGGLGKGNLGVFTARKGVGKTACLVHFATDHLLRGQKALHISFSDDPLHIENWYQQVYHEVARTYKLEHAMDIYDEIIRNRLILHFRQSDINLTDIKKSIERLIDDSSFLPEILIVDGFPFEKVSEHELQFWRDMAAERNVEIWFSATMHRESLHLDDRGIPAPVNHFRDYFAVIIMLNAMRDHIDLKLLKDHDSSDLEKLRLKLDPQTMLIANRRV